MKHFQYIILVFFVTKSFISFGQNLQLRIIGKDSLEQITIDSIYTPKRFKNLKTINRKIDSLLNTFQKVGFIEAEIKHQKKAKGSIYEAKIDLNERFYTIYIYKYKNLVSKLDLETISETINDDYFVVRISELEETLKLINQDLVKKGQPFAKVYLKNISKINNNLKAELEIIKNEKRQINNVYVKGYNKFPKSYIKHYLRFKPNAILNLEELNKKTEQINNLNFASETKPPEIQFTKDSTSVYLYVNKRRSNTFDGFLGFSSNENSGKIEFNGNLNLNLINNLNYGESLNLVYKSNENEERIFETNLILPYILGSPVGTEFILNIFKKDSTFTTTQQSANVFYNINPKHKISFGYNAIQSNLLINETTPLYIADYNSNFFNLTYQYLNTTNQNRLFPLKTHMYLFAGIGKRKNDIEKLNQNQINFQALNIFYLNRRNSIYLRWDSKILISDDYLENELFRFGGINSIRGFLENSLVANTYGLINTEYRYQLSSNIYVHSIIDLAYLENNILETKEKLFGFGFGLGILSNAGLIKLNYANGKSENQQFKFSNSKIHLSFKSNF